MCFYWHLWKDAWFKFDQLMFISHFVMIIIITVSLWRQIQERYNGSKNKWKEYGLALEEKDERLKCIGHALPDCFFYVFGMEMLGYSFMGLSFMLGPLQTSERWLQKWCWYQTVTATTRCTYGLPETSLCFVFNVNSLAPPGEARKWTTQWNTIPKHKSYTSNLEWPSFL